MSTESILMSIKPRYAESIFSGKKNVELRRIRPKNIKSGALVIVYVSSPLKSLYGVFEVADIIVKPINKLWQLVKHDAHLSRLEFERYYHGISKGTAIFIKEFQRFPEPINLYEIKNILLDFNPPQSFRYATKYEVNLANSQLNKNKSLAV